MEQTEINKLLEQYRIVATREKFIEVLKAISENPGIEEGKDGWWENEDEAEPMPVTRHPATGLRAPKMPLYEMSRPYRMAVLDRLIERGLITNNQGLKLTALGEELLEAVSKTG